MRKTLILAAIAVLLVAALVPLGALAAVVVLIGVVPPSLAVLLRAATQPPGFVPAPLRLSSPDRAPPRARA
ncbi:MAG TPA: hypothetical protein VFV54_01305 [Thermoanaerobaculia bacterium]|nr:hypothetical protein [Thermoanaerobaculia bacterium]